MSERAAVAEAVMHLVAEGLLPRTPEMVNRLSVTLRIPVAELREAWNRNDVRGYRPAPIDEPISDFANTEARDESRLTPAQISGRRNARATRRYQEANPEPGQRRCRRCGETQPAENFPVKDRRTGARRSYDLDCWNAIKRERYLSVKKVKALNAVGLEFVLVEADGPLGSLACLDCGLPLQAGDHVHGKTTLRHVDCEEAQAAWPHRRSA